MRPNRSASVRSCWQCSQPCIESPVQLTFGHQLARKFYEIFHGPWKLYEIHFYSRDDPVKVLPLGWAFFKEILTGLSSLFTSHLLQNSQLLMILFLNILSYFLLPSGSCHLFEYIPWTGPSLLFEVSQAGASYHQHRRLHTFVRGLLSQAHRHLRPPAHATEAAGSVGLVAWAHKIGPQKWAQTGYSGCHFERC